MMHSMTTNVIYLLCSLMLIIYGHNQYLFSNLNEEKRASGPQTICFLRIVLFNNLSLNTSQVIFDYIIRFLCMDNGILRSFEQ